MDRDLHFSERLSQARDVPELHGICRELAQAEGYEHFFYALRIPLSLTEPYHFCISGYPRPWRERYDQLGYVRTDPVVRHTFHSMLPVVWDELDCSDPAAAAVLRDAAGHGLAHGITAPVAGRHGDLALLSLARLVPISSDPAARQDLKRRLLWFAMLMHESVRRLVTNREGAPLISAPLSDREKDCLMWAADGKTSDEIARLLRITGRTVLFHLESAGRKLGASGRHNTVARAVALGEIDLNTQALRSSGTLPVLHEARSLDAVQPGPTSDATDE